jgi:hypothetical protein
MNISRQAEYHLKRRNKTINIKQYLSTNHSLVNNRHCVIKYSQTTQLYITKVFEKNSVVMIT